jgi:hypothetical protein
MAPVSGSKGVLGLVLTVLLAAAALSAPGRAVGARAPGCPRTQAGAGYRAEVRRALSAGRDVWGDELLARPGDPTYASAARFLHPLLFARGRKGRPLTSSGVYYLPFGQPLGDHGAVSVALHVADGSQILAGRSGRSLTVLVGPHGRERYGSCLARLTPARLADGYLPVLETAYEDADGVRYRQESFAARVYGTTSLVSFVRIAVDASDSAAGALVRVAPSVRGLEDDGDRLTRGGAAELLYSPGGASDGSTVEYEVAPGERETVYVGWLLSPTPARALTLDAETYAAARDGLAAFWRDRLAAGATFDVPDPRVLDAERSLLVQELTLAWRYSVGNAYQELSFPEGIDVARVMGSYGYTGVTRSVLGAAAARVGRDDSSWKRGELLLAAAALYRLTGDRSVLRRESPLLRRVVGRLGRRLGRGSGGLLPRERYSADVAASVYGLHAQAVAWEGLREIAGVWARTGHRWQAVTARRLSIRLGAALRRAVRRSEHRLADGSLFVPAALLDGGKPFGAVTRTRGGSYWNLVAPYALASGFFPPHGREARAILRYLLGHGSRLLGLVRAGAYSLYGRPSPPVSGTDQVYGTNIARFLADNDVPDQLVLSLYGDLADGMTPDTFVAGEAATVAPLRGAYYRSMFQPPNGAANAAFLETLRLMLVHETRDRSGAPAGLELAFATPRWWLRPGKRIAVTDAPTSFGPLSYVVERRGARVVASLDVPGRRPPRTLRLRLRLPVGERVVRAFANGRSARVDAGTGTIDLSGLRGSVRVTATLASS